MYIYRFWDYNTLLACNDFRCVTEQAILYILIKLENNDAA